MTYNLLPVTCLVFMHGFGAAAQVQNPKSGQNIPNGKIGWSTFLRGGYLHQFNTGIDSGGEFSVNRFFVQGGVTYSPQFDEVFHWQSVTGTTVTTFTALYS